MKENSKTMGAKMIVKGKWITGALLILCVLAMGKLNLEAWSNFSTDNTQLLAGMFTEQKAEAVAAPCVQKAVDVSTLQTWTFKVKQVLNTWAHAGVQKLFFSEAAPQSPSNLECTVEIQPVHFLYPAPTEAPKPVRL